MNQTAATNAIDMRAQRLEERKAELTRALTERGLKVEPSELKSWSNRLLAAHPDYPDVRIELMHQDRGFSEAWMVGKRHSSLSRRRFPTRIDGRGYNYDGIAKAVREMVEQRLRFQAQIAATKKMLAEQDAKDAATLAEMEAERAKMVQWEAIEEGDQRVRATPEGLRINIEYREPRAERGDPRLRVTVEVAEVQTASDAAKMVAGLKIAGLWL